jgi:two-component system sensor histidine kinase PilS (NtrC family)
MSQETIEGDQSNEYNSIRYLNLFRLFLSFFFFSIMFEKIGDFVGFNYSHDMARLIVVVYSAFSIIVWMASFFFKSEGRKIGVFALAIDLPILITIALLLNGINNGWAVLPVIVIGSFAMLSRNSIAILIMPIVATLLLWLLPKMLTKDSFQIDYSTILLYSLTYFAIALVGVRQSQVYHQSLLVNQRQKKRITGLSKVNALIIDKMPTGAIAFNNQYKIILVNEKAKKILKTSIDRLLPSQLIKKIISYRESGDRTLSIFGNDVLIDVVESKRKEDLGLLYIEDQNQINEKAQQSNLATIGQLSATVAHELRNPMSAIYSAAQLLAESENIDEEDKELTSIITSQIERSNQIIEDILLMSKRHIANKSPIVLNELLDRIKQDFCEQKLINPDQFVISKLNRPIEVMFDVTMINQIFWNLASNAIKHGEDNKLEVTVIDLKDFVLVDFKNAGEPFEPIVEESIFTPFFTTHNQGTGLGLFICKEMGKANQAKLEYIRQEFKHVFRLHIRK